MALKPCRECGVEVSTSAKKCEYCGATNPTMMPRDYLIGCGVLLGLTLLMFVWCGGAFSSSDDVDDSRAQSPKRVSPETIKYAAKSSVDKLVAESDILVSPGSAEYPSETIIAQRRSDLEGREAWIVEGAVDSKNRLGVSLRNRWKTVIVVDNGNLVPVCVTVADRVLFGDPQYLTE
ncbi:MAG: zinc ribbon domain-containing protein [Planctomycetaceae bacterium]|nr:zinc ribbon domain-containing protein [Planctomycetaceae bacterium]